MARSNRQLVMTLITVAASVIVTACASSPAPLNANRPGQYNVGGAAGTSGWDVSLNRLAFNSTIPVPIATAWANVNHAYSTLGIPLTVSRVSDHYVGNEGMAPGHTLARQRLSTFLECGSASGGPNADVYLVHMSVVTQLQALSDTTTRVSTLVLGQASSPAFANAPVECSSMGAIERNIAALAVKATP